MITTETLFYHFHSPSISTQSSDKFPKGKHRAVTLAFRLVGNQLQVGYAICSSSENGFSKSVGRNIAEQRLNESSTHYFSGLYYEVIENLKQLVEEATDCYVDIVSFKAILLDELLKKYSKDNSISVKDSSCPCDSWIDKRYG